MVYLYLKCFSLSLTALASQIVVGGRRRTQSSITDILTTIPDVITSIINSYISLIIFLDPIRDALDAFLGRLPGGGSRRNLEQHEYLSLEERRMHFIENPISVTTEQLEASSLRKLGPFGDILPDLGSIMITIPTIPAEIPQAIALLLLALTYLVEAAISLGPALEILLPFISGALEDPEPGTRHLLNGNLAKLALDESLERALYEN